MRTANPALNENTFLNVHDQAYGGQTMTIEGTVSKTGVLLLLVMGAAAFTWRGYLNGSEQVMLWMIGGLIGGLIFALITSFKPAIAMYTAPVYAICEGLFLGGVSAQAQIMAGQAIVIQAVTLTFGILLALLVVYRAGLIKATENFKLGVAAATGGICLVYIATILLSFFGISVPYIHQSGAIGIGFSLFVVALASMNLVLDFDFIENGAERGAPKFMEWYAAFGLMVTLIWLYLEILRLLAKLQSRR